MTSMGKKHSVKAPWGGIVEDVVPSFKFAEINASRGEDNAEELSDQDLNVIKENEERWKNESKHVKGMLDLNGHSKTVS